MRDVVMSVFGISHTLNTIVGNDFVRGVSGTYLSVPQIYKADIR